MSAQHDRDEQTGQAQRDWRELEHDPYVAAYVREVESRPELTREGEIHLMKQIEEGQREVREAVSRSRLLTREIIRTWAQIDSA